MVFAHGAPFRDSESYRECTNSRGGCVCARTRYQSLGLRWLYTVVFADEHTTLAMTTPHPRTFVANSEIALQIGAAFSTLSPYRCDPSDCCRTFNAGREVVCPSCSSGCFPLFPRSRGLWLASSSSLEFFPVIRPGLSPGNRPRPASSRNFANTWDLTNRCGSSLWTTPRGYSAVILATRGTPDIRLQRISRQGFPRPSNWVSLRFSSA